ncbi:hypothetical protein OZN62_08400 [Aurantiacibacter sp. MUD11]|uniref:hypothetical protein n=1 Tax=Aurantiacibacter sp. MUD11 TaxID=3003265 RepID=UPI0022AAF3E8|nr:hypothetical protein [Aurantiacibacter sp. MUD11]WAT16960.1 hypothetical protein OZN62_08400 [Aurantiacibacter sp. MUD11]
MTLIANMGTGPMKRALWASIACAALAACGSEESTEPANDAPAEAADSNAAAEVDVAEVDPTEDALVPGTEYHATAQVQCGFDNQDATQSCSAGVIRNWGEDGTTLVEVTKPDGRTRAIFFRGLEAYGADSAQADGSAGWTFESITENGRIFINYGPESYVIVDAFVEGG